MGDGPITDIFNKINQALVVKRFPNHNDYLDGADSCNKCHSTKKTPIKGQPRLELWPPYFQHQVHIKDASAACNDCHPSKDGKDFLPNKENCLGCHDDDIHPETGTRCTNCHALPDDPKTGHQDLYPAHKEKNISCPACHEIKDKKIELKPVAACITCHTSDKTEGAPKPPNFSHKKHDDETCVRCHNAKDTGKIERPKTTVCLSCHGDIIDHKVGKQPQFDNACLQCHGTVKELKPHSGDWMQNHGKPGQIKKEDCGQCHDKSPKVPACTACHEQPSLAPASHKDKNYKFFMHMLEARKKMVDCTSCHDTRTFCASCHASYKRMPEEHFAPNFTKTHGPQAKQDPEYCSACHGTGQRCFQCHPGGIDKK